MASGGQWAVIGSQFGSVQKKSGRGFSFPHPLPREERENFLLGKNLVYFYFLGSRPFLDWPRSGVVDVHYRKLRHLHLHRWHLGNIHPHAGAHDLRSPNRDGIEVRHAHTG